MAGIAKSKANERKLRLSDAKLAERLAGEAGVIVFRRLADGGMAVVNGRGQKIVFNAEDVRACQEE